MVERCWWSTMADSKQWIYFINLNSARVHRPIKLNLTDHRREGHLPKTYRRGGKNGGPRYFDIIAASDKQLTRSTVFHLFTSSLFFFSFRIFVKDLVPSSSLAKTSSEFREGSTERLQDEFLSPSRATVLRNRDRDTRLVSTRFREFHRASALPG